MQQITHRKSLKTLILCSLFLFVSTFFTKRWDNKYNAIISYDAAGYYLYLPSIFYDDLGKLNNKDKIIQEYNPFGSDFNDINKKENNNYILKYTCGIAILELPAFIVAHYWSCAANYPVDGFSLPYQICINFWSILFGIFGLWILRKILLKYFSDNAVALTIVVLCIASNLYNFISFSGNMSHSYLFTLYALILYYTDEFYEKPTSKTSILLGLFSGLAVLIRPIEIICLLIIFGWKVYSFQEIKNRIFFIKQHFIKFLLFAIVAIFIGSIQLIYWKIYSGHFIFWSYGKDEGFDFMHTHIIDGLFSYKKGWFVYTPVMVLSLIGFYFLKKNNSSLFLSFFLFFILNMYLVFSWNCWWYGGSFSQRAVVQSYAVLAFPLAAYFQAVFFKKILFYLSIIFVIFCTWLNFVMTYQAYSTKAIMENELMSKKYYWKIFGKLDINKSDKKYIDLKEELPKYLEKMLTIIYFNDFEQDTTLSTSQSFSGNKALVLNKEKQQTNEIIIPIDSTNGFYKATVKVFANDIEWNVWKQTQWIIALYNNDKEVKTNYYRIYRVIQPNIWQEIDIAIETPCNNKFNNLKIKFWNANSDKQLQIDDLKVQFAKHKD